MSIKAKIFIFLLGLLFSVAVASFQSTPGYMDADYYFATGLQLAEGKSFTEPFLWNYLDDPVGIPHPSHAFWMPLTSLVAAFALRIAPGFEFASAQWIFILLSAFIPYLTALLAYEISKKKNLALMAAFFASFSGFYIPFLTTTDSFALYMIFGALFFIAFRIKSVSYRAVAWGVLVALMHLSRADGLMWLGVAVVGLLLGKESAKSKVFSLAILFSVYLSVMLPWFARNFSVFGAITVPGSSKMLWLTDYDQVFSYHSNQLTMQSWLNSGWPAILDARWWAFKQNLNTLWGIQGQIILLPFMLIGSIVLARDARLWLGLMGWLATFVVMTAVFPFAGARGSFFHSGAALQPFLWVLASVGFERAIQWFSKLRRLDYQSIYCFAQISLLVTMVFITGFSFWSRQIVVDPLSRVLKYEEIERVILLNGGQKLNDAVILANPPGYFISSKRSALALPDGNLQTVLQIAERYQAKYLVIEQGSVSKGLAYLLEQSVIPDGLLLLQEFDGAKVFMIVLSQ
jgi:hypothetical protein